MNNSAAALAEMPVAPPTEVLRKRRARDSKNTRRSNVKPKPNGRERYFLGTGKAGDQFATSRELKSEQEALVAAFQEKVTFFVVNEYRVETQFKGASAMLVKEGVSRADS